MDESQLFKSRHAQLKPLSNEAYTNKMKKFDEQLSLLQKAAK